MSRFSDRLAALLGAHAVADYPLQGDFLARAKNRHAPIPGVPWYQALIAHAAIHGLAVGIITRSVRLGVAETVVHAVIDDVKCSGLITYNQDQLLHALCKAFWSSIVCRAEAAAL